jgi:hypothetical protein
MTLSPNEPWDMIVFLWLGNVSCRISYRAAAWRSAMRKNNVAAILSVAEPVQGFHA